MPVLATCRVAAASLEGTPWLKRWVQLCGAFGALTEPPPGPGRGYSRSPPVPTSGWVLWGQRPPALQCLPLRGASVRDPTAVGQGLSLSPLFPGFASVSVGEEPPGSPQQSSPPPTFPSCVISRQPSEAARAAALRPRTGPEPARVASFQPLLCEVRDRDLSSPPLLSCAGPGHRGDTRPRWGHRGGVRQRGPGQPCEPPAPAARCARGAGVAGGARGLATQTAHLSYTRSPSLAGVAVAASRATPDRASPRLPPSLRRNSHQRPTGQSNAPTR